MIHHEAVHVRNATAYEATHECAHCGVYSAGVAYGRGAGWANVLPIGGSEEEATETASLRASEAASKDALRLAALAPCPRCGRRNTAAVLDFALRTGLPLAALAALGGVIGTAYTLGGSPSQTVEAVAAIALVPAIRAVIKGYLWWSGSSSRVELEVAPHPDE